jgi:arylsulfatase A-like enzyme
MIPSSHGASVSKKKAIRPDVKTMAEILRESDYKTASFNGGAQMSAAFGFGRGFEVYKSFAGGDYTVERFKDRVAEGIEWLEQNKSGKFFLFLHSYDIHHPYAPDTKNMEMFKDPTYSGPVTLPIDATFLLSVNKKRREINDSDRKFIVSAYDGEIRGTDDAFAELVNYLRRSGLYDNTIIVFTSDHGEEFNEHGWMGWHSHTLYDELLRVPFAVKFPHQQFAGTTVNTQVRGIDMLPTVLDVLGISAPPNFEGRSLMKLASGKGDSNFPQYAISQRELPGKKLPASVRSTKWKLHGKRLYNLEKDPGETDNVADEFPGIVEQLKGIRDRATRPEKKS